MTDHDQPLPSRSLNAQHATFDPVIVVTSSLHLEARLTYEEPVVDIVSSCREVRLERELVIVDDVVACLPKTERVLAGERLVVAVEPAVEAIDVNEGFPLTGNRCEHLVKEAKMVLSRGDDGFDPLARSIGHFPAEREKLILQIDFDAIADLRLVVEHHVLVRTLIALAGEQHVGDE